MQEQLISFKTAKLAKEKGFESILLSYYESDSKKLIINEVHVARTFKSLTGSPYGQNTIDDYEAVLSDMDNSTDEFILAPTQSLLQRWLREVHSIEISVRAIKWENTELKTGLVLDSYEYEMYPLKKPYYIYHKVPEFKTYELALEEALQEALKLIKNVNKSN